jgi:glycosyltransferase involved in cell wall biosynthesis
MKILYDYNIFYLQKVGGISKYFTQIYLIIRNFYSVRIVAPIHVNDYLNNIKNKEIVTFVKLDRQYKFTRSISIFLNNFFFRIYINFFKPDIIHLTYYNKELNFKKNCKVVITVYDLIHEIFQEDYNFKYPKKFKKNYIDIADHIICISENTKKDLLKFYEVNPDKISVIKLGFDTSKEYQEIKDDYLSKPYLLYVGDRKNYKNFKNLIISYSLSEKLKKDFNIVCFGGGGLVEHERILLQKLNINLSKIKCLSGSDLELNFIYKQATAYICPSFYEGFGLTILEAMNMNCPIISSNAGSLPEVGGDFIEYFDPYNIDEIKNKIEKVVYSETNILKQKKNFSKNLQKFSWEATARETMYIYEKLQNK